MSKRRSSKPGKIKNIPMPGIDGKSRSRRQLFDDAGKPKRNKQQRRDTDETPLCRHCIANGRGKPNRVRRGAFGQPLDECLECLTAAGSKAHKGLADMGRIVPTDDERRRSNMRVIEGGE